jgi:moderate conductance mechanosensitive channel
MNEKKDRFAWFKRKTKGQKVTFICSILIFLISITILVLGMNVRPILGDEAADNLYGEGNANGWVVLGNALTSSGMNWLLTVMVICVSFILMFIINFLTRLFSGNGRKGKTIGALVRSLAKYVIIIVDIALILGFWGVNVASILAGVGIVTLIIGLGCQTLIQDVIAGLFIVFDDYFAVGDICIIDGFRGTIADIGLKTTKIKDAGGNIKSINNSSITTVVDLSREDSLASVELTAGYNEDPVRVEAVILEAIPKIKEKLPQITGDITYKGVSSMNASDISYLVVCRCKEADRFQVVRDLTREFLIVFEKNDIQIVFPQVTVNQPDSVVRPSTTTQQQELSAEAMKNLRKVPEEQKNERFTLFRKARQSFDETAKGFEKEMTK